MRASSSCRPNGFDVVVGAGAEAAHLVDLAAPRREQDDRHVAQVAQPLERLEAVELRHRDVEHDEVCRPGVEGAQRGATVCCRLHRVARRAEQGLHEVADVLVVVDDKNAPGACHHPAQYAAPCGR
jgi:hypothetical protein